MSINRPDQGALQWRVFLNLKVQRVQTFNGQAPDFMQDETTYSCGGTTYNAVPAPALKEVMEQLEVFMARLAIDPKQEES